MRTYTHTNAKAILITVKTATTMQATARPAMAPTLSVDPTLSEGLAGLSVGATLSVGLAGQKAGLLQIVLQAFRRGNGHNTSTMQPEIKRHNFSCLICNNMNVTTETTTL